VSDLARSHSHVKESIKRDLIFRHQLIINMIKRIREITRTYIKYNRRILIALFKVVLIKDIE